MEGTKRRESGIELLRIILMVGVIILHFNNANIGGGFKDVNNNVNYVILLILENIFVCAVDVFVIITGYFLCDNNKRSIIKIIELILQVILFKIGIYVISSIKDISNISIKGVLASCIPNNYFVILYITLYLISPYLNIILKKLNKIDYQKMLIILIIIFCCWNTLANGIENISKKSIAGLTTIGMNGNQAGYTIVNFILLYIIGAYIRLYNVEISKKKLFILVLILVILFVWSYIENKYNFNSVIAWNYDNVLVILQAAIIFLIFKKLKKNIKVINELAKASFTTFLIHTAFFRFIPISSIVNLNFVVMFFVIILSAIGIYIISYLIYKIYYWSTNWFIKYISTYTDKININVEYYK